MLNDGEFGCAQRILVFTDFVVIISDSIRYTLNVNQKYVCALFDLKFTIGIYKVDVRLCILFDCVKEFKELTVLSSSPPLPSWDEPCRLIIFA
jgi:hypothetical protein